MNDLISIIVPVYNAEKYLYDCIESIIRQTYKNLEIILVDDGSTDNSGKICDDWKIKDNRIKVFHKENGGVSSARNFGIQHAKGEYITFIDSDDFVLEKHIECLYKCITKYNADFVISDFIGDNIVIDKAVKEYKFDTERILKNKDIEYIYEYLVALLAVCWGNLIRKDVIVNNKICFDTRFSYGEDKLYTFECLLASNKTVYIPAGTYVYKKNNNSLTRSGNVKKILSNMREGVIVEDIIHEKANMNNIKIKENNFFMNQVILLKYIKENKLSYTQFKLNYKQYFSEFFKEIINKTKISELEGIKLKINYILLKYNLIKIWYSVHKHSF